MTSLEQKLYQEILPLVNKPGRYIGNEINVIKKDWSKDLLKFALIFPDLYEIGMSHIGFEILYHILNSDPSVVAERVYAPAVDMEEKLRAQALPLFSLETKQPLANFDILGFTLQYELHYTNVLNILDLGGIPILSQDRDDATPLVIAGGPCAFNPEPLANFIDAFVIGDGEEVIKQIVYLVKDAKRQGETKDKILHQLARTSGIYVPKFYCVQYNDQKKLTSVSPIIRDVPPCIYAQTVERLKPEYYPTKPLVPLIETTHDRYSVEIMRGCTQGCRFCNAGIIYRPVRERTVDELTNQVATVIRNTGYDEISLASLSSSDYSQINLLLSRLTRILEPQMVNVSFPSLRTETFSLELAKYARKVKKSGLTLAPEAGTERLRNVINKTNSNDDLLRAISIAYNEGWEKVKLYFMIGQPEETFEDLEGIITLIREVLKIANQYKGRTIHISVSPFAPKPQTPFQWVAQNSISELQTKIFYLKDRLPENRIKFNWREPEVAFLEAVLARGDRSLGEVIVQAWKAGAKFDAWDDQFRPQLWRQAFEHCHVDPALFNRKYDLDEVLPWDHISKGVTKEFLVREYEWALKERTTPDCRKTACNACGMMSQSVCRDILYQTDNRPELHAMTQKSDELSDTQYGRSLKKIRSLGEAPIRAIRIKYEKREPIRFTSHLDLIRIIERAFRRAGIKLVYSQGFHPHPRIAYGPPLPMFFTSDAEYMDVQYYREQEKDIKSALNRVLPPGLKILDVRTLYGKHQSLASIINRAEYQVVLSKSFDQSYLQQTLTEFLNREQIIINRLRDHEEQEIDIRPFIHLISIAEIPAALHLSLNFLDGKSVRVSEILSAMLPLTNDDIILSRVNRTNLLIQYGDVKATPMEI